ncbi:MAG: biopolymer transporter ExbD [Myxococcota bacterium]
MGLSKNSQGGRPRPAMNVTPLVDIVLVLLIIFMVVLPNQEKGAAVEVPTLDHAEEDPDGPEPFSLSIDRNGRVFFESTALAEGEDARLVSLMNEAHGADPERKLMLRADGRVSYGRIRSLFGAAQEVGFPGVMMRVSGNPDRPTGGEG